MQLRDTGETGGDAWDVRHPIAKVGVAGSNPVVRSRETAGQDRREPGPLATHIPFRAVIAGRLKHLRGSWRPIPVRGVSRST